MLAIKEARYLNDYKIRISFNDGRSADVDLEEIITQDHRPIFSELKQIDKFQAFQLSHDTIVWPNELDLAPEFLYFQAFKDDPDLKDQFNEWGYL